MELAPKAEILKATFQVTAFGIPRLLFFKDYLAEFLGNEFAGQSMADLIPMTSPFCIACAVKKDSIPTRVVLKPRRQIQNLKTLVVAQGFDTLIRIEEAANA